ncbi:MAG: hypothetical protein U0V74_04030 [Chitinophagales bacterium]
MKSLLTAVLIFTISILFAKKIAPQVEKLNVDSSIAEMQKQQAEFDSAQKAYYASQESLITQQTLKNMNNNLDSFMRMQREKEASQNKVLLVRVALFVATLIVFIIGMSRKSKKNPSDDQDQSSAN